jgi:hypothetical protein
MRKGAAAARPLSIHSGLRRCEKRPLVRRKGSQFNGQGASYSGDLSERAYMSVGSQSTLYTGGALSCFAQIAGGPDEITRWCFALEWKRLRPSVGDILFVLMSCAQTGTGTKPST